MDGVLSHATNILRAGMYNSASASGRHARAAVAELEAVDDDTDEAITHGGYGVDDVLCWTVIVTAGWSGAWQNVKEVHAHEHQKR